MGPTARSHSPSPSHRPPSVSRMAARSPSPFSWPPMIGGWMFPEGVIAVPAPLCMPCLDSTRPMPATMLQRTSHPGSTSGARCSALR